jgi:hypothetical protein
VKDDFKIVFCTNQSVLVPFTKTGNTGGDVKFLLGYREGLENEFCLLTWRT